MTERDWLDKATAKIRFRPDRRAVRRELEAHLEDLREASGLEEEAALEVMGDPEAIAEELGRLHRPWLGYLWRASQIALAGAAAVYCLLLALLALSGRTYLLPGNRLYAYLNWEGGEELASGNILEERAFQPGTSIKTGGYTIRADRALLRKEDDGSGARWNLYIELDITSSRWKEPLNCWQATSALRTDAGSIEEGRSSHSSASWGFWQKCSFALLDFPEEAAWVELDFGFGELERTLHIDLTEEAET